MKKSTFHYVTVFFFLYLIGELYWLNNGENYYIGRALNIALLIVLGCMILYEEITKWRIRRAMFNRWQLEQDEKLDFIIKYELEQDAKKKAIDADFVRINNELAKLARKEKSK